MNYKSYGKKLTTPSRMARKHMRREVFVSNKKLAKTARKKRRLERIRLAEEAEVSYE
jgi:hypothetical protein